MTITNDILRSLLILMDDVESEINESKDELNKDSNITNSKRIELLTKLHKSLMKSHRIALRVKAIENYGEEYDD